jgi:predicted DNA-binding transcriptional regulator
MPMKDISPILKSLGFLESEIKTYLTALALGPSTVIDLTKRAQLSRQAIYVAIESLTERGIMSSTLVGKKRFYSAERPEKLLAYAKRRENEMNEHIKDLETALPELAMRVGGERPSVKVLEGKEGLRAYLVDLGKENPKMIHELTDREALLRVLNSEEDLGPVRKHLIKTNSFLKAMYTEPIISARPNSEVYALPKEFIGFGADITVYGNTIVLVSFGEKMQTVIIEDGKMAAAMRILFEISLKEAKRNFTRK